MRVGLLFLLLVLFAGAHRAQAQILPQVRISGLTDLALGNWGIGDPAINTSLDICVYSKLAIPAGAYLLTVTSSTGSFALKSGSNQIPFTLSWEGSGQGHLGGSGGLTLLNGILLSGSLHADTSDNACASGPTARLYLAINQADLTAAKAGTYSSTLSLLVSTL